MKSSALSRDFASCAVYSAVLGVVTVAACTLRTVSALSSEIRYGFFSEKTLSAVGNALVAAAILLALSYAVFFRRQTEHRLCYTSPSVYLPSGPVCVALVFFAIDLFQRARRWQDLPSFASPQLRIVYFVTIICAILALLSVAFFLLQSVFEKTRHTGRAALACIASLFCGLYVVSLCLNTDLPLHAPAKIIDRFAYLAVALFLLGEARLSLGRYKGGLHIATGFIATLLTSYAAVPELIVYLVRKDTVASSFAETILTLTLLLFVFFRLVHLLRAPVCEFDPFVRAVVDDAHARAQAVASESSETPTGEENGTECAEAADTRSAETAETSDPEY